MTNDLDSGLSEVKRSAEFPLPGSSARNGELQQDLIQDWLQNLRETVRKASETALSDSVNGKHDNMPKFAPPASGKPNELIRLAQLVADQTARWDAHRSPNSAELATRATQLYQDPLWTTIQDLFPGVIQCDIDSYKAFPPYKHTYLALNRNLGKTAPDKHWDQKSVYPISPLLDLTTPKFRVRRESKTLDVSLQALEFWEELGLSPAEGQKDTVAFGLFPKALMSWAAAQSLMRSICNTYMDLRLGTHSAGSSLDEELESGLIALPEGQGKSSEMNVDRACENMGAWHDKSSIKSQLT